MKLYYLFIFLYLLTCRPNISKGGKKLIKASVFYVDNDILTPFSISCEQFGIDFFRDHINSFEIDNEEKITELYSFIEKLKGVNKTSKSINVRYKIVFYWNDKSSKLVCGSGSKIFLDNKNYLISRKLSNYIKNIISAKGGNGTD